MTFKEDRARPLTSAPAKHVHSQNMPTVGKESPLVDTSMRSIQQKLWDGLAEFSGKPETRQLPQVEF